MNCKVWRKKILGDGSLLVQLTTAATTREEFEIPQETEEATRETMSTVKTTIENKTKGSIQLKKQRVNKNSPLVVPNTNDSSMTTTFASAIQNTTKLDSAGQEQEAILVASAINYEKSNNLDEYDLANYVFTITTSSSSKEKNKTDRSSPFSSASTSTTTTAKSTHPSITNTTKVENTSTEEPKKTTNSTSSVFSIQGFTRTSTVQITSNTTKTEAMLIEMNENLVDRLSKFDLMSKRNLTKEEMIRELDSIRKILDAKVEAVETTKSSVKNSTSAFVSLTSKNMSQTMTTATAGTTLSIELNAASVKNETKYFNISSLSTDYIEGVEFVEDEENEEGSTSAEEGEEEVYDEDNEVEEELSTSTVVTTPRSTNNDEKVERMSSLIDGKSINNNKTMLVKNSAETNNATSRMETYPNTKTKPKTNLLALERPFKAERNSSNYSFQMSFTPKVESFKNEASLNNFLFCTHFVIFVLSCNFYLNVL